MIRWRLASKSLALLTVVVLAVTTLAPATVTHTHAQESISLTVSVPSLWEDVLSADVMAEFEAQHPGVTVQLTFTDTAFFGFGGPSDSTLEDRLDETEEFVTTADVLYIDSGSVEAEDTQAGYFLDLKPLVMNDPDLNVADFYTAVWNSYQWDNGMWALPVSTDVILMTYDPVTFDEAGLAYPNERWTIDDFANAARQLTEYDADGAVTTPGMTVSMGGNNLTVFLRALLGTGLYDATVVPNTPALTDPALEALLTTWYELEQEGVVIGQGGGFGNDIPLRVEGISGYSRRPNDDETSTRYASLLPGGVAGLDVQGFAVSAGTQYPEMAYQLAKFLTTRSELSSNNFSALPARVSLANTTQQANSNNEGGQPGQPGAGGPGGGQFGGSANIPDEIKPLVDQGVMTGLPMSELRYTSYLNDALFEMRMNGTDAVAALQTVEAQAYADTQAAIALNGTLSLYVVPPATGPVLAPGEIALTCAVNLGFGGRMRGDQFPNQEQWDQIIQDYVASEPSVGAVILETVQDTDLATLAEQYDCFVLPTNAVPGSDLSSVLNLDPLIDTDPTFDRNDIIGNTLAQLQQDNKTWALPIAIQPQMLEYDQEQFAWAGIPEPINGWTVDAFTDALRTLKPYDTDPVPFSANDPSGSYIMMLIGAFGGLPFDYRTDPPTVNFTDPATVDAIRQVLDLVVEGYIEYSSLTNVVDSGIAAMANTDTPAITTNMLSQYNLGGPGGRPPGSGEERVTITTTYPQGNDYGVIAYEITTGYISTTTQNPDATYRFLSMVARNPQLFSGMPARQSLVSDPAVVAAQGENVAAVYQQLDTLLSSPNTIVFPTYSAGRGMSATSFVQEYWLKQAFDEYVMSGADLELELADAETLTLAYLDCVQGIVVDETAAEGPGFGYFQQINQCATGVDPEFSLMD
ncbi:MAG: extracellular solute-binding protein [Anaerolineae bacterium]|nr:extracellular solute-binding protein [Anaerolineae bacterium]